jgi:hypothetical protein
MKIIITENRIFNVAKKELTKKFGDLTPFTYDEEDDIVYYINNKRALYFEYDKERNYCLIGDTIWDFLTDIFGLDDDQIKKITKEWLEDYYNLKDVSVLKSEW